MGKILSKFHVCLRLETDSLQDTAGQERFSSLSSAFFRGADAVLMVYDVTKPQTFYNLKKWWHEFQDRAPVPDDDAYDYCCVVVGNKVDLVENESNAPISEEEVMSFLERLVPSVSNSVNSPADTIVPSSPFPDPVHSQAQEFPSSSDHNVSDDDSTIPPSETGLPSQSPIDIRHTRRGQSLSRATSRSRFGGTMTTTHTGFSVYYTPPSSIFDEYISAPSSPTTNSRLNPSPGPLSSSVQRRRGAATSTTSSSDTITPTTFALGAPSSVTLTLERGPKHFLASAKSAKSVPEIFQYISKRVVSRWEWEDQVQSQMLAYAERSEIRTVNLQTNNTRPSWAVTCCGS